MPDKKQLSNYKRCEKKRQSESDARQMLRKWPEKKEWREDKILMPRIRHSRKPERRQEKKLARMKQSISIKVFNPKL